MPGTGPEAGSNGRLSGDRRSERPSMQTQHTPSTINAAVTHSLYTVFPVRRSCGGFEAQIGLGGPVMPRFAKAAASAATVLAASLLPAGSASADIVVMVDKAKQRMFVLVDGEHRYTWPVST